METKDFVLRHTMRLGAMTGGGLILVSALLSLFKLNAGGYQFISYLVIVIGIVNGIKQYRDVVLAGTISYQKSLIIGILIAFFSAFIISVYTYVILKMDASSISVLFQQAEAELKRQGFSETQIKAFSRLMTPELLFLSGVFSFTLLGLLFSLVASFFLKREALIENLSNEDE